MIWGVNGNSIFFRTGVSAARPVGVGWKHIGGALKYVAAGDGKLIGSGHADTIYVRLGIGRAHPEGTTWKLLDGRLL